MNVSQLKQYYEEGKIIITDTVNDLKVYHYRDGETDQQLLNIRGIIANEEQIVCKTFGYSVEVVVSNVQQLNELISPLVNADTRFYKSFEGTLLRVWNYQGTWNLSTHRKINASTSKWGHRMNYGDLFCRALRASLSTTNNDVQVDNTAFVQGYFNQLNADKIYVFLMKSFKENRKVCYGKDEPSLHIVGAFDRTKNFEYVEANPETQVPTQEALQIDSGNDLIESVVKLNPYEYQGIVLINADGTSGKVIHMEYDRLDKLRGNVPNVLHRYVQLFWSPTELAQYKALYPEFQQKFEHWNEVMNQVVKHIYDKYIERFVKHQTALLPQEQYAVMLKVHELYWSTLRTQNKKVTVQHVWQVLSTMEERDVNTMFKQFLRRQKETGNGNTMPEKVSKSLLQYVQSKTAPATTSEVNASSDDSEANTKQ